MGANHFSWSVVGADPAEVENLLVNWLRAKGYDRQTSPPITPLDRQHEHGLMLASSGDRTVVLTSRLETAPRMMFELVKLGRPVLEHWMHDSDIWGYQLWHQGFQVAKPDDGSDG